MSTVSLTLQFESINEASVFLSNYVGKAEPALIAPLDNPAVGGVSEAEKAAVLTPLPDFSQAFNPFRPGAAVAQIPPPPVAPSTAAVAVPSTAPVAPTSTATVPAPTVPAPPSAPAAAAPAAPAAPTSLAGIEVDADGLPWDARIHASGKDGKPKNADGRWRQKRGLNDGAFKARVEAELRQAMGAAANMTAVAPSVPVPLPQPVAAAETAPAAPVPTTPAAPSEEPAPQFLMRVGGMLASGTLTQDRLNNALTTVGLSTLAQLITAPALIPVVRGHLGL
jgi:hypothetical protein